MKSQTFKDYDLHSRSVVELWALHQTVIAELSQKIKAERDVLDARLRRLSAVASDDLPRTRRPYPKVLPKFRNLGNRGETWSGRGKQPRWLAAQIRRGKKLNDFLIG